MAKAFARQFYSSKRWQACRNEYMKRVGKLCENCMKQGIYRPAEIVHHVIEITPNNIENPEITLSFNNLEAVCRECHDELHGHPGGWSKINEERKRKKLESQRYQVDENGTVTAR